MITSTTLTAALGFVAAIATVLAAKAGHLSVSEGRVCERWAVVVSGLKLSDKARQLTGMSDWCVLVVGDEGPCARDCDMTGVTHLSAYGQDKLPYRIVGQSASSKSGRRNIGFMYAIHHGAKVIYDVDSDTYLTDFLTELPAYEGGAAEESLPEYNDDIERKGPSPTFLGSHTPRVHAVGTFSEGALRLRQYWLLDLRDAGHDIWQRNEDEGLIEMSAAAHPTRMEERALTEITLSDAGVRAVAPSGGGNMPHVLLVIAVVSARPDRRDSVRESWRKWGDRRVKVRFFTERPPRNDPHAAAAVAALEREMVAHGDLLIMDIEPGMNFALKLLWAMRWMSERFTFDFFLRLDDDYFLCLERLLNELDATLAASEHPVNIFAGHRYCRRSGHVRIDEAYLLLSNSLVKRILSSSHLRCGGHGGVTASWWFTRGNALNLPGDVEWVHDFRLDHKGQIFLSGSSKDFTDVCLTHMGVHHTYADMMPQMWRAAQGRPAPGSNDTSSAGSLLRYVDDDTCSMVGEGVSDSFFERDNAQPCDAFTARDITVHCGEEGCLVPPP